METRLSSVIEKYFLPEARQNGEISAIEWAKSLSFELQPFDEIYLNRKILAMVCAWRCAVYLVVWRHRTIHPDYRLYQLH